MPAMAARMRYRWAILPVIRVLVSSASRTVEMNCLPGNNWLGAAASVAAWVSAMALWSHGPSDLAPLSGPWWVPGARPRYLAGLRLGL